MRRNGLLFLFTVVFVTVGCHKPSSSAPQEEIEAEFFVNGDPLEVVQGTKLNGKSFLTLDNYKSFSNLEVTGKVLFAEKTKTKERNQNDIESAKQSNKTPTETKLTEDLSSEFLLAKDGKSVLLEIGKTNLVLRFVEAESGTLVLNGFGTKDLQVVAKPVHYSINPEKTAFSFLFSAKVNESEDLWGISFQRRAEPPKKLNVLESAKRFFYMFGKGALIPQDAYKVLKLTACGKDSELFRNEIASGVDPWRNILHGRVSVEVEFSNECLPIFDVNSQSLQFLEKRVTRASKNVFNPAATFLRASFSNNLIVGTNILIFKGEYKRMTDKTDNQGQPLKLRETLKETVMHEFGHVLGLGHPFDSKEASIMGYDPSVKEVTKYDIDAITTLYPAKSQNP